MIDFCSREKTWEERPGHSQREYSQGVRQSQQVRGVQTLHAHPGQRRRVHQKNLKVLKKPNLKNNFLKERKSQKVSYRGSTGSSGSNKAGGARLSLVSGISGGSRKSNRSRHTTRSILSRRTIGTLASLVTLRLV